MELSKVRAVYFVGIGGIGMSALARYFLMRGVLVAGYDKTPSPLTRRLEEEGAKVHYDDDPKAIPEGCLRRETCLVVYTPAIPESHEELTFFRTNGFEVEKRAWVLGALTRELKGLCVAGTHGKTTTSSMTAHLLAGSPVGTNAFLGGIAKNYGTNYLLNESSEYVVIEADEYDRSFHHLRPWASVITATDADHLDIYGSKEAYLEAFSHYTSLIRPDGYLLLHRGLEMQPRTQEGVTTYTYSREGGDFHAENIRTGDGSLSFDLISPLGDIRDVELGVPVGINVENGIAAMALAQMAGVKAEDIRKGMGSFEGVERRFDFHIRRSDLAYLSDYAHHPEEIRQCIRSIKELYKGRRVRVIFQPHLYSRTRDFAQEFADALSLADDVVITDIYPARELPIEGVTSRLILDKMRRGIRARLVHMGEIPEVVKEGGFDVLITMGAGDIENYAGEITSILGGEG